MEAGNTFIPDLPAPKTGGKYTVRVQVSAGGGEDFYGKVTWRMLAKTH